MKGLNFDVNRSVIKIIAIVVVLTLILSLAAGCGKKKDTDVTQDIPVTIQELNMRDTILYYSDSSGYIVPIMKKILWEEGIAKAALKELTAGTENDIKLNSLGLSAPVPMNTQFDLDIADGVAIVDIVLNESLNSLTQERCMLSCVINTLMEFPTVDKVDVMINSEDVLLLDNGLEIKEIYEKQLANLEPQGVDDGFNKSFAKLYFISSSGKFLVPTSRMLGEGYTPLEMLEALKEPVIETGLQSVLPIDVEVLDVRMVENQALINLSNEFEMLSDFPNDERMAITAINYTMTSLEDVDSIQILVDGKLFEGTVDALGDGQGFYNILD